MYRDGVLQCDVRLGAASDAHARMLWFSATKPVTAVCVLLLAERGLIDLDTPMAEVWPEFAHGDKEACTPRHVLTHQGGFPVFPRGFDWTRIGDWAAVMAVTAGIEADWAPGTVIGYHPVTYGFVLGEVMRRADGRMPREFMRDEVFGPLRMEASLGTDDLGSVVRVEAMSEVTFDDPEGSERRTSEMVERFNAAATLRAQIPAGNGLGTAEALARFYAMLEQGGSLDGVRVLRDETVREATRVHASTLRDRTSGYPAAYGLGFLVGGYPPLDMPGAFGHFGQQSTVGWCDPERGIAAAYLTNGLHEPGVVTLRYAEMALAILGACEG